MRNVKQSVFYVALIIFMIGFVSISNAIVANGIEEGGGEITNVVPVWATPTSTNRLSLNGGSAFYSPDTGNATFKVHDANGAMDLNISVDNIENYSMIVFRNAYSNGGSNSTYEEGYDIVIYKWKFVWAEQHTPIANYIGDPYNLSAGLANITNGTVVLTDTAWAGGSAYIKPGLEFPIPRTWNSSWQGYPYGITVNIGDEEANVTRTFAFTVRYAFNIEFRQGDGLSTTSRKWGNWTADPTGGNSGFVPANYNSSSAIWLLVQRTGGAPTDMNVTISWSDIEFVGDTYADTIPIDGNIFFTSYITKVIPGTGDDPANVTWDTANITALDLDGDITIAFAGNSEFMWVYYMIDDIATDDVVMDDTYSQDFTVVRTSN